MKVIVRCANNRVTKAEMEREIERLFQENKDLRLSESHLRDDLNLSQQQSEARRQVICERDKLIQELNDQITASETDAEFWKKAAAENAELAEQNIARVANVGAERDNFEASYKQVLQWWEEAQSKAVKAEAAADEYRITAMESDCRVNELEKRIEWLQNERKLYENNVERLTYERDTAVKGNAELIEENAELRDNLDAVINIKNEYAETIDEMRKKIVAAQSPEFTAHLAKLIIANLPSTDK